MARNNIELRFNILYKDTWTTIDSPLDLVLANIFVGYFETKMFINTKTTAIYWRYATTFL